ncbi:hypothetical protein J3458_020334 [Metarhizium acridum]|uniref:uncharacterized protein n=1 Tax=Metarhizium acridum TaxID=92637 RepID=UPI001C6BAF57|nr:hypothetical protein J3458_020334 [Metarhizium acridum]
MLNDLHISSIIEMRFIFPLQILPIESPTLSSFLVQLGLRRAKHEYCSNDPNLHFMKVLSQGMLKVIWVILTVLKNTRFNDLSTHVSREPVIFPHTSCHYIGPVNYTIRGHVVLDM